MITQTIERGQTQGEICDRVDGSLAAEMLTMAAEGLQNHALVNDDPDPDTQTKKLTAWVKMLIPPASP